MNWIGITILVVTSLASLLWLVYELAKRDILFTFLSTWEVKFIDHGETLHRIIYNTPGYELKKGKFVSTTEEPRHNFLGLYLVGLPLFASVHRFTISKEKENPSGKNMSDWIIREKDEEVSSLRFFFPRPYAFPKVELGGEDPVAIDVVVVSKFRVVDPVKMVYGLKGRFFENAGGIVRAAVGDVLNDFDLKNFIDANKGEDGEMLERLRDLAGTFNIALEEQVGLVQTGIALSYDPANEALREAMEAKTIAKAKGEATKTTADAEYHKNIREAQAKAKERELRIAATLSGLGGDTSATTRILVAEAHPNVTTEIVGGVNPVVPVGGKP